MAEPAFGGSAAERNDRSAALLELLWSGTGQACRRTGPVWVRKGFLGLRVPSPAVPDG
jgi:hypothetical protein